MNKTRFLVALISVFLLQLQSQAQSQSDELPKFEVAAEFTTLERPGFGQRRTEPGFGGRFTYNLNRVVALEAAGYFFPKRCFQCQHNGNITEVVGGVKIGKRFEKWGIFAKARPGVASFSQGRVTIFDDPTILGFPFRFEENRLNGFAADLGAVLEFYPTKRIVTRFDAGDTIIHLGPRQTEVISFDPTRGLFIQPIRLDSRTTNNFQFMASVGFRF
jgi:hypothetical protein